MRLTGRPIGLLAIAMFAASGVQGADDERFEPVPAFTLKGFGTAAATRSNDDNAEFVRDLSQPNGLKGRWSGKVDSVLGIQADFRISDNTSAVVQGITRYRYDGSWRPELSWAFLRHEFSPDVTARVGRLGTEFYMLADSRLVGYSNLTIRPAPEYYGPLVLSYFDGFDVSATTPLGAGLLRGKLFAGLAAEKTPFAEPLTWDLRDSPMVGGNIDYLVGAWQFRIGHAQIQFKNDQPINQMAGFDLTGLAPELKIVNTTTNFDSIGMVYDEGPLQVHGMLSRIGYDSAVYEDTRAGYLVVGYRIGRFTPYVGLSRAKSKAAKLTTPLPPFLNQQIRQIMAQTHSDQHTITLGTRWDFQQNLALKAQLDFVRGNDHSRFPVRNANPDWDGRMTVFSVALDFVF